MREKTIYEKIAEKYNTTPEEVRREMQIAIDAGFDDPDPAVLFLDYLETPNDSESDMIDAVDLPDNYIAHLK